MNCFNEVILTYTVAAFVGCRAVETTCGALQEASCFACWCTRNTQAAPANMKPWCDNNTGRCDLDLYTPIFLLLWWWLPFIQEFQFISAPSVRSSRCWLSVRFGTRVPTKACGSRAAHTNSISAVVFPEASHTSNVGAAVLR